MSKRPNPKLQIQSGFHLLKRASKWPVWADLITRLGVAFLLIGVVVLVHWIDRDGLIDHHDGKISFLDVVYFTMISVTTTGFGDIAPISDRSRLIEAVIVTPIRIAVLFIFVGTAYNFVIKRTWEKWRMARIQSKLTNHIVVLGYGVSGAEAVHELIQRRHRPVARAHQRRRGGGMQCARGRRLERRNARRRARRGGAVGARVGGARRYLDPHRAHCSPSRPESADQRRYPRTGQ